MFSYWISISIDGSRHPSILLSTVNLKLNARLKLQSLVAQWQQVPAANDIRKSYVQFNVTSEGYWQHSPNKEDTQSDNVQQITTC